MSRYANKEETKIIMYAMIGVIVLWSIWIAISSLL